MKKNILFTLAAAGLLLASCGGGSTPSSSSTVPGGSSTPGTSSGTDTSIPTSTSTGGDSGDASIGEVTITLTLDGKDTIAIGGQCMLTATVTGAADTSVTWESSNDEVATVDDGVVIGVGEGTVTITATSVADPTKKATQTITVIDRTSGALTVAELLADEGIKALPTDGTTESESEYVLKAKVAYIDAPYDAQYKNISFYVYDDGKPETLVQIYRAKGDSDAAIDISGLKALDTVYVYGKVKNYKGTLEFSTPLITKLEASEETLPVATKLEDATLFSEIDVVGTVHAIGQRGYVVTDGEASVYVFTGAGKVTYNDEAKTPIGVGDVVNTKGVMMQALNDHGFYQVSAKVSTMPAEGNPVAYMEADLTAEAADGLKNAPKLTGYKAYTWETTIGKDGNYLTYNVDGSDTKIEFSYPLAELTGQEGQKVRIGAYFVGYDTKYKYATFVPYSMEEVLPVATEMTIEGAPANLKVGESVKLSAVPGEGTALPGEVEWDVDDPEKAEILADGTLNALAAGEVTVSAVCGQLTATVAIQIVNEDILATGLSFEDDSIEMYVGATTTVEAIVDPEDSTEKPVYSIDDETVATVDAETGEVTAVGEGTATVTATIRELTATIEIEVTDPYGSETSPRTPTQVVDFINSLEDKAYSDQKVYVEGIVTKVDYAFSAQTQNMSLHIKGTAEGEATELYLFKVHVDSETDIPSVNDKVLACGYVQKYVTTGGSVTPEMTFKDKEDAMILKTTRGLSTVTLGDHEHATVEGLPTEPVANGSDVTFTVTPDQGYAIAAVKAGTLTLEPDATTGNYTFKVDGPMTVTVTAVDSLLSSKVISMDDTAIAWPSDYPTAANPGSFETTDGLKFGAANIKKDTSEGILLHKGDGVIYNTEAIPGAIKQIDITFSSASATGFKKIYVTSGTAAFGPTAAEGATANISGCAKNVTVSYFPEEGAADTFFQIANLDGSNNGRFATITIYY